MHALIAGASGLVGKELLEILLSSDKYESVTSLVRRATGKTHPKLTEKVVDFDKLAKEDVVCDVLFCCVGTTMKKAGSKEAFKKVDFEIPLELALKASVNDVFQYNIITAMGANKSSFFFYNRVKGEIEMALKQLKFPTLNIYRPSLLVGDRKEERQGEEFAAKFMNTFNPLMIGPFKKYRSIHVRTVAMAMYRQSISKQTGVNILTSDQLEDIGNI